MTEKKVSRHDARLLTAGIDLAQQFIETQGDEERVEGIFAQVFGAIAEEMEKGSGDVQALWRTARKVRSLKQNGGD